MPRAGTHAEEHCPALGRRDASLGQSRWRFLQQQERKRTFRHEKETARVPEEDERAIDWDAALDEVFRPWG
jgi:hypothetical protein